MITGHQWSYIRCPARNHAGIINCCQPFLTTGDRQMVIKFSLNADITRVLLKVQHGSCEGSERHRFIKQVVSTKTIVCIWTFGGFRGLVPHTFQSRS